MKHLFFIIMALVTIKLEAQLNLIEPLQRNTFISESNRIWVLEQRENDPIFKSVTPIKLNSVFSCQLNGRLKFNIPNQAEQVESEVSMVKKYSETNFIWRGDIKENDKIIGFCIFIQKENKKFGQIEIFGGYNYLIEDLGTNAENDQILLEIDRTKLPNSTCGGDHYLTTEGDTITLGDPINPVLPEHAPDYENGYENGDGNNPQESPCSAEISVLFLYTQEVVNSGADIEQIAIIGIENLNETLEESKIPNTHVKASIAGYALWAQYQDNSSNAEGILNTMRTSTEVINLRDQFDADLVILIQKTNLTHNNSGIGGLAYINEFADINYAYSVCNYISTSNPKLIGHETGHCLDVDTSMVDILMLMLLNGMKEQ